MFNYNFDFMNTIGKTISEERSFIESASREDLFLHVQKKPFHSSNFPLFCEKADMRAIKYYLGRYSLNTEGIIYVLENGSIDYLEALFAERELDPDTLKYLFENGSQEAVCEYVRYHDLPEKFENMLFTAGFDKAAMFYVSHYILFVSSEVLMMEFGGKRMLKRYIEHEDLHTEAELLMLSKFFDVELLSVYTSKWCFSSEAQKRYDELLSKLSENEEK